MGNRPSVFVKTPQEHLEYSWNHRLTLPSDPLPGHVRVCFYTDWNEGLDESDLVVRWSALRADVPLEPSGDLDLGRVRKMWGLEKCAPIHPDRRIPFEPQHPDHLSSLAVGVLTDEEGVLKLFEPSPSEPTIQIREKRMHIVRKYQAGVTHVEDAIMGRISAVVDCISHPFEVMNHRLTMAACARQTQNEKEEKPRIGHHFPWPSFRHVVFTAALLFLVVSGAFTRYLNFAYAVFYG
ncbi:hypothetical protein BV22DRAFT_790886 [Leucogyrophana mollusca]|uniref:Uncharacterized protein n=1 Tax=Leucogyrophana mollusca TaxID=85980 RepID=A0ACB8B4L8_9AGAM|nr:hypothetical protein BV22DRAFT_790886 [Leucogyrophana mollusca]